MSIPSINVGDYLITSLGMLYQIIEFTTQFGIRHYRCPIVGRAIVARSSVEEFKRQEGSCVEFWYDGVKRSFVLERGYAASLITKEEVAILLLNVNGE